MKFSETKPELAEIDNERLWRSPLGEKWFMAIVILMLILTFIKFVNRTNFIPSTQLINGKETTYDLMDLFLYGCWLIGPPLIFLIEYVFIFGRDEKRRLNTKQVADLKYCHELASKVWAGVSVFLSIILLTKYGIKP